MTNILLLDANTAYHIGNAALVESTIEQLKTEFTETQFTILAFDPDSIAKMFPEHKVIECLWPEIFTNYSIMRKIRLMIRETIWIFFNTLNFGLLKKIRLSIEPSKYTFSPSKRAVLEALSDSDIVVSISGEMLSKGNLRRLPLFLYGYWLGHIMGRIVAIFPQSIGPFENGFVRVIVRNILNKCDLILPRDQISLTNVERAGISRGKVHLVPDVAVNQPCISSNEAKILLKMEGVNLGRRPLIGITISRLHDIDYQNYSFVIKQLIQFITTELNCTVVFFSPNMPYAREISDFQLAQDLYKKLADRGNVKVLSKLYSPREFKGMLGELDLFISTRMHAVILATMIGTPTITINTQPKLQGYMEMIGQEARACEIKDFTLENAKNLVDDTLANSDKIRLTLKKATDEVGTSALMAAKLLKDTYDRKKQGIL